MRLLYKGTRPFVVFLKQPEFYLKSVSPGETLELSDQTAAAILALYGADFEAVIEKIERRNKKVVDYTEVK